MSPPRPFGRVPLGLWLDDAETEASPRVTAQARWPMLRALVRRAGPAMAAIPGAGIPGTRAARVETRPRAQRSDVPVLPRQIGLLRNYETSFHGGGYRKVPGNLARRDRQDTDFP